MISRQHLAASLLLLSLFIPFSKLALAHELRPAVADISQTASKLQIAIRVNLEALISEIGPEHDDSDDAPQAERYRELRALSPEALDAELQDYLPTLLQGIVLSSGNEPGLPLPLQLTSLDIPSVGDQRLPRDSMLHLETSASGITGTFTWKWDARFGSLILRSAPAATVPAFSQYLQAGERSEPVGLEPDSPGTASSGFLDYIVIGFEHIIPKGLDHILFVIGLFLLAPAFKPIVWQVSMFTLAHTITLALGITGIISLPASIVEPLIALSITAVCVENLFGSRFGPTRLTLVFAFGLLHGLGFAGVLSDIGLTSGRFASSLLAFNLGVEFGQLSVVLLCFALVGWWFGKKPWYRQRITNPASLLIGAIGFYWFLQRVQLVA